jgi:PPM family protein phosphatase
MGLILHAASVSDAGRVRSNNEDSAHAGRRLLAVADGMGGMPAGELASDIVIQALAPLDGRTHDDPLTALRHAVDSANARIRKATESDRAQDGMGTTVTALLLSGDRIGLLHVGDSRCYLFRDSVLTLLTRDDTFVQALVDQGVLSPEQARTHPRRSVVTQAVQGHDIEPTCRVLAPRLKDRFLVCSDGLSDVVTDSDIATILGACHEPKQCARRLVSHALDAGGPDNVTVVVADVASG